MKYDISVLSTSDYGQKSGARLNHPENQKSTSHEHKTAVELLCEAWRIYERNFGRSPRGTVRQMAALLCLGGAEEIVLAVNSYEAREALIAELRQALNDCNSAANSFQVEHSIDADEFALRVSTIVADALAHPAQNLGGVDSASGNAAEPESSVESPDSRRAHPVVQSTPSESERKREALIAELVKALTNMRMQAEQVIRHYNIKFSLKECDAALAHVNAQGEQP